MHDLVAYWQQLSTIIFVVVCGMLVASFWGTASTVIPIKQRMNDAIHNYEEVCSIVLCVLCVLCVRDPTECLLDEKIK